MLTMAQSDAQSAMFEGVLWLIGMIVAVVLAAVVVVYIRRRSQRHDTEPSAGFSLSELRRLRNQGALTVPEYEALRDKIVRAHGGAPDARSQAAAQRFLQPRGHR